MQTASADQVLAAPKVASEGVFGNFRVPPHGAGYEWVVSAGGWLRRQNPWPLISLQQRAHGQGWQLHESDSTCSAAAPRCALL